VGGTQETWASTAERLKKHWPKFATIVQHELHRAIASLICSALNEQCNEVFRVERVEYDESQYKRTTIKSRDMGILCSWEMSFPLDTTRSDHVEGMLNVFFPAAVARAHCITPAVKPIASSLDLDDTTVSLEIRTKTLAFSLSDVRKLKEGSMLSFPSSRVRVTSSGRAFFEGEVKKLTPSISISVLSTLKEKSMTKNPEIVDSINDIDITISVELGRKRVTLRDIKQISAGSMIELDKMAGEPVDIFANNSLIGKGEVCVTSGDIMTIRVVDINDESILDD
jgi:flagellar motor switch protein FliN